MAAFLVCYFTMLAAAQAPKADEAKPTPYETTIQRGLEFLARDALAWKHDHNCVSCHHASMMVWAMCDARQHGFTVNEPVLNELTKWVAESGDGTTSLPRPSGIPKALNTKAVWFALALAAVPQPDESTQKGLALLRKTIGRDQLDNGSWASWPDTKPPFFGNSDDSVTALATLAVASGTGETALVRDRGARWLQEHKSDDDPQSVAMRLVLWTKLGRPAAEWRPLARLIIERQNEDGGWSQAKLMASDAWATGQAIYALTSAGLRPEEPALIHARDFLIKTQRPDGSWPMTSRPNKPGGTGATSLIPIVGGGSAWAVLGLVQLRTPPKSSAN